MVSTAARAGSQSTPDKLDASCLLSRASHLSSQMAELADDIQIVLGGMITDGDLKPGHRAAMSLQELDRVSQTMRALARLVDYLAKDCNGVEVYGRDLGKIIGLDSVTEYVVGEDRGVTDDSDELWG